MIEHNIISHILNNRYDKKELIEIGLNSGKRIEGKVVYFPLGRGINNKQQIFLEVFNDFEEEVNIHGIIDGYDVICINLESIEYVRYNSKRVDEV